MTMTVIPWKQYRSATDFPPAAETAYGMIAEATDEQRVYVRTKDAMWTPCATVEEAIKVWVESTAPQDSEKQRELDLLREENVRIRRNSDTLWAAYKRLNDDHTKLRRDYRKLEARLATTQASRPTARLLTAIAKWRSRIAE